MRHCGRKQKIRSAERQRGTRTYSHVLKVERWRAAEGEVRMKWHARRVEVVCAQQYAARRHARCCGARRRARSMANGHAQARRRVACAQAHVARRVCTEGGRGSGRRRPQVAQRGYSKYGKTQAAAYRCRHACRRGGSSARCVRSVRCERGRRGSAAQRVAQEGKEGITGGRQQ